MRGVSVIRFEDGDVLFFDCAWNFDGTAYHPIKKLLGSQVLDIIGVRVRTWLSDRLLSCGLQGLVRSV
jgi:hypothetical protein